MPAIGPRADWNVDTAWLSYVESDDRVAVAKSIGTLTRATGDGSLGITLVHDTMSGASPTGAVRSDDPAVTYTGVSGGASGGAGFEAGGGGGDGTMGQFEDTRLQAALQREQSLRRSLTLSYGGGGVAGVGLRLLRGQRRPREGEHRPDDDLRCRRRV